jgi:hypothetical protein
VCLLLSLERLDDLPEAVAMLLGDRFPDCAHFVDDEIASHS